eukprot:2988800-Prymnesium_polylepis.1
MLSGSPWSIRKVVWGVPQGHTRRTAIRVLPARTRLCVFTPPTVRYLHTSSYRHGKDGAPSGQAD